MLTDEDRKYILNELLRNIHHISDKEYQRRIWIRGEGPEAGDFTEAVCQFFDSGDPILDHYKDFWLTDNQCQILKKFRDEFKTFAEENDLPQLFIDTPEWTKITLMAKKVLEAFNYHK